MDTVDTRPPHTQVRIELGERSYDILIGAGLLGQPQTFEGLPVGGTVRL